MGILSVLLLSVLSFIGPFGDQASRGNVGPIEIKTLIIPAFQSRMISGGSLEGGGVWGTVVGGNVTARFPDGYIVLKASSDADQNEIRSLIKKKIATFPCSCGDLIQMKGYTNHLIKFDPAALRYERFEFHSSFNDRIIAGEYFLYIEPIVVRQDTILLNFEVKENLGPAQTVDKPNKYFKEELFNQAMVMSPDQTLLVGFAPPKIEDRYRGSAYWFIIKLVGYKNY